MSTDFTLAKIPNENILSIIPLLKDLDPSVPEELLEPRLLEMIQQGYICIGAWNEQKELVGCCGIWIFTRYYCGKMVEPDNMIVSPKYQGHGLGQKMLNWVLEYGRSQGCDVSELNCYTGNHLGQKFWTKNDYRLIGFHYQKKAITSS